MNAQQPDAQPRMKTGTRVGIGCLALTSVMSLFFAIILLATNDPHKAQSLAVFGVPAVLCGIGAYMWYRSVTDKEKKDDAAHCEKIVLQHVASTGGATTVVQIVQNTPLSSEQAEATIERLSHKGLVHLDLLDDGTVLYRFGSTLGKDEV